MATVLDVAAYILEQLGNMTAMKLQKLVYYSQAWSLVWDEKALFDEPIQAWANGPVVPRLYDDHKGRFIVDVGTISGNSRELSDEQRDTIKKVLAFYGSHNAQWLSDLTHAEDPWRNARKGLQSGERGDKVIPLDAMMEYYSSLPE